MTTATIENQYQFTTEITAKGKQQNSDGWAMTVGWKLPGSRYHLVLYGQDWETVEGFEVGHTATITIQQGNLKNNKDGKYSSDFFWDMESIEPDGEIVASEEVQAPPKPKPTPSEPRTGSPDQPPPNPAALGACQNHAHDCIINGIWPIPEGREYTSWLWECRDRIYRYGNQRLLAPLHYCYEHDEERRQGKNGGWGHLLPKETDADEDSYCIEGREGWRVFDAGH